MTKPRYLATAAKRAMMAKPTLRNLRAAIDAQAPLDREPEPAQRKKPRKWTEDTLEGVGDE